MERRLGRGLGALLAGPGTRESASITSEIPLDRIDPNPFQPRTVFDDEGLEGLRASIENHGVLQPVVVRPAAADAQGERYELISGERRCRASRMAGKTTIAAVTREGVRDDEMLELALVENVQRRDLDPIERARAFRQLVEVLHLTQDQVAQRVGLQRSTVSNLLRLLELPEDVQAAVAKGLLSMGHARALLPVDDPKEQAALVRVIVRDELSVREVERRVRARKVPFEELKVDANGDTSKRLASRTAAGGAERPAWMNEIEGRLRESLGTKVRLQNGADYRGQIIVEYYDRASLDSLIARLAPRAQL